ncbi:MAG: FtsW/RodA/SpoVE family cell cycle protein [Oscillospiraceae bacterium]|nr:FtsW/RodA/SpoVE family cell cycle protein [Oscillospiraceae bacterium]
MLQRTKEFIADIFRQADMLLLALCTVASLFGILMIASATHYTGSLKNVIVQACALLLGVGLYFIVSAIDMNEVAKHWKWLTAFNFGFILLLVTPLGLNINNNRAWLGIEGFPINVQPAEVVKITFIIVLAKQLVWLKEKRDLKSVSSVAMLGGHLVALIGVYYVISGDMGSALVYIFIFVCMVFVAGVAKRWIALGLFGGAFAFYLLWQEDKIPDYMKMRFLILFDHDLDPRGLGWQQTRGLLALGGGKLTGMGLFQGTQTQSESAASLPFRHTDFIFTVVGEELGLIGCLAVIGLLAAIILRCFTAARRAKTTMDAYICVGMGAMLIFQTVANIGMCLFVMPVIGLTLPFFSYGGSSIVTLFVAMGVVSGVQKRSRPEWLR